MIIIPAIDIIEQKPVRLYQGNYEKKEIVGQSVLDIARGFERAGAKYIHLVDLDGAKDGRLINKEIIINVAKSINIPIEVGGGIRSYDDVKYLVDNGVSRIILGTMAIENKDALKEIITDFKDKIAIGVDCRNGYLCTRGWIKKSNINYIEFSRDMEYLGIKNIIVTDISKDGTLMGSNIEMLKELQKEVNIKITASGGVRDIHDIKKLKEINIYGVIIGKALYSGNINLKKAIEVVGGA